MPRELPNLVRLQPAPAASGDVHDPKPAPLSPGVRSVHVGVPILLPQGQYHVVAPQASAPAGAPTDWTPWRYSVVAELPDSKPSLGDARWTPIELWDILGLRNGYERWPNTNTNKLQGPTTKVAFGSFLKRFGIGDATRPTPSLPLPQPIIAAGYGFMPSAGGA